MKLYTEEQVIALTKSAFTAGQNHNSFIFWEELKNITPIELPSDEEIWNEADKEESNSKHYAFTRGARYVIDKIQRFKK